MKGGVNLSIKTVTMVALGIMMIVLMYLTFETVVDSLVDSFLSNLSIPSLD